MMHVIVDVASCFEFLTSYCFIGIYNLFITLTVQINEFVKLGGDQLVPYYADILGAILPCISDKEEKIRVVSWFKLSER